MMAKDAPFIPLPSDRASVIDVFENFLGTGIGQLTERNFEALAKDQAGELVAQIDIFLEAASGDAFADDAITLDGFASPIILPRDHTEPRTTRRAKQVALAHSEVVIPLQEFSQDYSRYGRLHLSSFCQWLQRNEKLLRSHVFSLTRAPDLLDILEIDQVTDLADLLMEKLTDAGQEADLSRLMPNWQTVGRGELDAALSPIIYTTLQDTAAGATLGTNLSFTQEAGGRCYQFCADALNAASTSAPNVFAHSVLLHDLELPSIDNLPDEDFVGIRLHSEDFGQFREVLGRSLGKTARQVEAGEPLDAAFRQSLDEVRWRAELLRHDTRDKHLAKFFRTTFQGITIGSIVSTAAAAAAVLPQSVGDVQSLAFRFGTSLTLGTLFALLLYQPPKRKQRLLRFYDMLLDPKPSAAGRAT